VANLNSIVNRKLAIDCEQSDPFVDMVCATLDPDRGAVLN
jgi:hypothetical protein